jgi:hypothetical protein
MAAVAGLVAAAGLAVAAVVTGLIYGSERAALRAKESQITFNMGPVRSFWKFESKGILRPPIFKAEESGMRPDEAVFGVEVGGKARAYRSGAFHDGPDHLVNDMVDGVPVSVAYCDITDCVQVYTDPRGSAPLDVAVAGLLDGEMVVKLGGVLYFHKSSTPVEPGAAPAAIPYDLLTPTRTTWKEWLRRHPGTDVYVGVRKDGLE